MEPSSCLVYRFVHAAASELWFVPYIYATYPWAVAAQLCTLTDGAAGVAIEPTEVMPLLGVFVKIANAHPDLESVCIDIGRLAVVWDQDSTNVASIEGEQSIATLGPNGTGFPYSKTTA